MSATNTSSVINLHARRTREARRNSALTRRAERVGGMISSFQRDSSETPGSITKERSAAPASLQEARVPEPDVGEKWPMWKSATFLIVYCSLAWGFIGLALWLLLR